MVTVVFPDGYIFTKTDSAFVESYVFGDQFQKKPGVCFQTGKPDNEKRFE